jgi:hypothetical protein
MLRVTAMHSLFSFQIIGKRSIVIQYWICGTSRKRSDKFQQHRAQENQGFWSQPSKNARQVTRIASKLNAKLPALKSVFPATAPDSPLMTICKRKCVSFLSSLLHLWYFTVIIVAESALGNLKTTKISQRSFEASKVSIN